MAERYPKGLTNDLCPCGSGKKLSNLFPVLVMIPLRKEIFVSSDRCYRPIQIKFPNRHSLSNMLSLYSGGYEVM
ncbi:MAG: SEC-C domain-containing protein [Lachnospiraceae bacterium]|nr:SEC-C domain-containing protein [Lachnospiraceae bacterium]